MTWWNRLYLLYPLWPAGGSRAHAASRNEAICWKASSHRHSCQQKLADGFYLTCKRLSAVNNHQNSHKNVTFLSKNKSFLQVFTGSALGLMKANTLVWQNLSQDFLPPEVALASRMFCFCSVCYQIFFGKSPFICLWWLSKPSVSFSCQISALEPNKQLAHRKHDSEMHLKKWKKAEDASIIRQRWVTTASKMAAEGWVRRGTVALPSEVTQAASWNQSLGWPEETQNSKWTHPSTSAGWSSL